MKYSAMVMSIGIALAMTTAMVPQSSAQTQPANAGTQPQQQNNQK
jgi:hypothetical protein